MKKIFIIILSLQLLLPSLAYPLEACLPPKSTGTFTRLCNNVDDVICKDVPDQIRRSCDDRDRTIIHSGMSANEVYNFAKGCMQSAAKSFVEFFTEFLPELCKAIWNLSKGAYQSATSPGFFSSIKGAYESARSMAADVYEAIKKDPGLYFSEIWSKITDAVGPVIAHYDCMNPQAKVEKICGLVAEWVVPPAILAKVIVRGTKAAKELVALKLATKLGKTKDITLLAEKTKAIAPLAVESFKTKYAKEIQLKTSSNKDFIKYVEKDTAKKELNVLYFDVENAVQKTLNDQVFVDKTAVDAINNSFFEKFNHNLRNNPDLMGHLEGEYKDYKSYRLRLKLKPGEDPKKYEDLLAALYKKTNEDFVNDQALQKIVKTIPPRTDAVIDPANWFLSGSGDNALEANMSARIARNSLTDKAPQLTHFRDHVAVLSTEVHGIEKLRKALASNQNLIDKKIIEKTVDGVIIPSKSMIGILRKVKPSDFTTEEAFISAIRQKTKNLFGENIDVETAQSLALYFKKVDALSPPLFSGERVAIDLNQAKNGIISIDFAGVGVDNIYEQMRALTKINYKNPSAEAHLQESFTKMQEGVNQVTHQMSEAKESFSSAIAKVEKSNTNKTLFSGDDGIFMPATHAWSETEKATLVHELSQTADPSKYRVTFVSTHFPNGKVIPSAERSKRIVRAESIEKEIRSKVIGIEKITDQEAKKFITAIDYAPNENGGVFNLILGGKDFSPQEIKSITDAFKATLESGEKFGKVIVK